MDEGLLELMRSDLEGVMGLREVRMFGALCFMIDGHMLCGVHKHGALYRVGKPRTQAALAYEGAQIMTMTGRPMAAIIDVSAEAMGNDDARAAWLALALENVASLPPKEM